MKKTILITGGLGYIGKNITDLILKNNFKVIIIDNLNNSFFKKFDNKDYKFIKCDILNKSELKEVFQNYKIDLVIHTAALIKIQESEINPIKYFNVNIIGTVNILEMMEKYKIKKIIFSSSAAIYGNQKNNQIKENDKKNPINTYGLTKLIGEELILKSENIGIKSIIFRYFNLAGKNEDSKLNYNPKWNTNHFIPITVNAIKNNKDLIIFGNDYQTRDKTCIRDYIHISDLSYAHLLAINYLFKNGKSEIFNLASGKGHSNLEIAKLIEKEAEQKLNIIINSKRREGDPDKLIADISKLEKILNYKAKYSIIDIVKSELNF